MKENKVLIKEHRQNPIASIIFNGETLNAFLLRSEQGKDVHSYPSYST